MHLCQKCQRLDGPYNPEEWVNIGLCPNCAAQDPELHPDPPHKDPRPDLELEPAPRRPPP